MTNLQTLWNRTAIPSSPGKEKSKKVPSRALHRECLTHMVWYQKALSRLLYLHCNMKILTQSPRSILAPSYTTSELPPSRGDEHVQLQKPASPEQLLHSFPFRAEAYPTALKSQCILLHLGNRQMPKEGRQPDFLSQSWQRGWISAFLPRYTSCFNEKQ